MSTEILPAPTPEHIEAARALLSRINEERSRLGMRPIKSRAVKRALPAYFARGLSLRDVFAVLHRELARADPNPELLYPTRLAKLVLSGEVLP